jgi:DNA-binding SARP family transcriptional activator
MAHRLNILGTLDLRDAAGTPVSSVLQQPRRLGLLVYLALADRDGMVKRDTLLGLFWPEMSQESGRRALSQAIHFLRKALGRDAIIGRGIEDLALNPEAVGCDAARFQAAVKAGDLQTATATYVGDLLPGFYVSGAPELDQWLSNAREALRRSAAEVFWSAAEEAKHQGRTVSAAASARRAAGLASESETATRRLMEFLESIDDRAGALEAYDGLVRTLQTEYESTPSAKTRDIAERIRRSGAAALVQTDSSGLAPAVNRLRSLPWQDIRRRSKTLTGALIIMFAFVSLWGLGNRENRLAQPYSDASLIIETPEVFDAALHAPASRIITDASAALVAVPNLVVSTKGNARFRLEPTISGDNGEIRVSVSLVDVTSGTIVRSAVFHAHAADTAALRAAGHDVSEFARKAMGQYLRATTVASLKGQHAEALRQSMRARIKSDSLRDEGLVEYAVLTLERADSALSRAIDEHESAALYVERAEIAWKKHWLNRMPALADRQAADRAILTGIKHADAAIRIDRKNAAAQEIRGLFASTQWRSQSGEAGAGIHRREAELFLRSAVELNPNAIKAWNALSSILFTKGDFVEAYWAAEQGYAADTYLEIVDALTANLFSAALETGDLSAAARWCADLSRRSENDFTGAFCSLQLIARADAPTDGDVLRAETLVAKMTDGPEKEIFGPLMNSILAVVYARSGDAVRARALLAQSERGPSSDEAEELRAWAIMEMGHRAEALSILKQYVQKNPSTRAGVLRSVRFASHN